MNLPNTITVPERFRDRFQSLVERKVDRGIPLAEARREVAVAILERGMNMLDAELSEQEAKAHERAVKRNGHAVPVEHRAMRSGALQAFEREHGR
jgi:hypothetical protein